MKKLALGFLFALGLFAQQRQLEYMLPRGGSLGSTVDVVLTGQYLQNPKQILFYGTGIKAVSVEEGTKRGFEVKAKLEIAANCPIGEHVLRLRTNNALTEPVTFWVSRFPTVLETEKKQGENDTVAKAQSIPLNSTVEGQISAGAEPDVDVYQVSVEAGKRISVEVEAIRLGTTPREGENDLMVRILDADGKQIGIVKDSALFIQDPVASIVAPTTGKYFVEIKQQIFIAPRLAYYRAHIGTFSRPLAIYPAGGPVGTTLAAHILGDPTGERTEQISLPKKPGDFPYFSGNAPSANTLRVSPYPNVLKAPGPEPTPVPSLPAALNGILTTRGQADTFQFTAKKDQQWKIRVYARSLGSPMDPKIWVRSAKDSRQILAADDSRLPDLGMPSMRGSWVLKDSLDPVANFKVPADGDYVIGIEDGRGTFSPVHVYRIEIEPIKDAVYTHITQNDGYMIPRMTGLIIPKGDRWTIDVQIAQGFGNQFKGDIELEAVGLPKGVTIIAPKFIKGATRMPVQFIADETVEPQAVLMELLARPVDKKLSFETGARQGFALINRGNELPLHMVFLDRFALAVVDPAPFRVELEQPAAAIAQNGELPLKVKVFRNEGFKEAIEIIPDWLPNSVTKGPVVTIPADKAEGEFVIHAGAKATAGAYRVAITASSTVGDAFSGVGRTRVSSKFVDLTIAEPYVNITILRSAVERGQKGQITATLEQKHPFPGQASLSLKNLPKGVEMVQPAPKITVKDKEITFNVTASPDALAGLYKDLTCEIVITDAGQKLSQQSGNGILRVDPARLSAKATVAK